MVVIIVTIENYGKNEKPEIIIKKVEKMESNDIQDRENELRRILDGSGSILVGDKWFGPESTLEDRELYRVAFNRRMDRNRKRRERRMALATFEAFERNLVGRPAWVQSRLTGRTAVVETVNGLRRQVNYMRTYGLRSDPFAYPFPGGRTPLELLVDGGIATWGFVLRGQQLLTQRRRETLHKELSGRLRDERRKLCARSTLAARPTATDIRVAWAFVRESHANMLHLGGLLHDLECFLQNELQVMWIKRRPKIIGRSEGIRGWLRENCPELIGKYKTLMRYKALARRLRQVTEIADPVPTSVILTSTISAEELLSHTVTAQPHASDHGRVERFAWEHGEPRIDAYGRGFLTNDNYRNSSRTVALTLSAMKGQSFAEADRTGPDTAQRLGVLLESARRTVDEILTAAAEVDTASTRHRHRRITMLTLWDQIGKLLVLREKWWEGETRPLQLALTNSSQWSIPR